MRLGVVHLGEAQNDGFPEVGQRLLDGPALTRRVDLEALGDVPVRFLWTAAVSVGAVDMRAAWSP